MSAETASDLKEWRPDEPIKYAPVFDASEWSFRGLFKYWFGYPGYFAPWNLIYYATCAISHQLTTPSLQVCSEFQIGWLAKLFMRNELLLWIYAGGWHALLYWPLQVNGTSKKYAKAWPAKGKKFLFGTQTYENVFWSSVSGVFIWTAYEALFLRMWAKGRIGSMYPDWRMNPVWSLIQLLLIPFWREFHFYWTHRLIHWGPLYRMVHYLHHKNVNPGPWSGLSMHPVEHVLYFSVLWPHMFIPGHPLHFFFNAQHTALTPASGHSGFHHPVANDMIPGGSYFHYLHHRYFECNYGEATIPLDRWFGTFRDGQNAGSATSSVGGKSRERSWITVSTLIVGSMIGLVPLFPILHKGLRR
eukprot:TRINITY_DN74217_c0_g1_i1.p1 TRINITY_DN74217_c0_g1~~TRINITY_DN74217_c0_g1_i1.p1  ORF type:complete len:358 (+),score=30.27 TRINITY_DN74217_c0_g1_i1:54-1127(+)